MYYFLLHAGDCQGNAGSCLESIGAPVKRYTSIMIAVTYASVSIVIYRRLFEEGASCFTDSPSKVPKMYVSKLMNELLLHDQVYILSVVLVETLCNPSLRLLLRSTQLNVSYVFCWTVTLAHPEFVMSAQ